MRWAKNKEAVVLGHEQGGRCDWAMEEEEAVTDAPVSRGRGRRA